VEGGGGKFFLAPSNQGCSSNFVASGRSFGSKVNIDRNKLVNSLTDLMVASSLRCLLRRLFQAASGSVSSVRVYLAANGKTAFTIRLLVPFRVPVWFPAVRKCTSMFDHLANEGVFPAHAIKHDKTINYLMQLIINNPISQLANLTKYLFDFLPCKRETRHRF
jgi:hypothetical protein